MTSPLPTELILLGWSVILLFVQMAIGGALMTRDRGLAFNMGPRDAAPPVSAIAGRADRTLSNYKETWPAFVALALALAVSGRTGGIAATGAWIWFLARIVYVPLYLLGIPVVRTLCWIASIIGLLLMLGRLV